MCSCLPVLSLVSLYVPYPYVLHVSMVLWWALLPLWLEVAFEVRTDHHSLLDTLVKCIRSVGACRFCETGQRHCTFSLSFVKCLRNTERSPAHLPLFETFDAATSLLLASYSTQSAMFTHAKLSKASLWHSRGGESGYHIYPARMVRVYRPS